MIGPSLFVGPVNVGRSLRRNSEKLVNSELALFCIWSDLFVIYNNEDIFGSHCGSLECDEIKKVGLVRQY